MRIFSLIFIFLTGVAHADDFTKGGISIIHPFAFETTGRTGAGYFVINNEGPDDWLIEVRADFPRVMMHETIQEDGVAKMQHFEAIHIAKDDEVAFAPGGYHVMFMGLSDHWREGDKIPATLVFDQAGEIPVVFHVKARKATGGTVDHSAHTED